MIDEKFLLSLARTKMPYGSFKGTFLIDLHESYVVWYRNKGFPNGKLGKMLGMVYELKVNGLDDMIQEIKRRTKNYK